MEPRDRPSRPGSWPRPAMALLCALFCCLLAALHCGPCLGLPLAPGGGRSPAPAVGELSATLSLEGAARQQRTARRQKCASGEEAARGPRRGGRGTRGTRASAPAGRSGLGWGPCPRQWGRCRERGGQIFPSPSSCVHFVSPAVCSKGSKGAACLKGKRWELDAPYS